jgi:hypothetical protein
VIPEDKTLVNVLYICEVNNCGHTSEYSNKIATKSITHELFTVAETYTRDIWCQVVVTALYTRQYQDIYE